MDHRIESGYGVIGADGHGMLLDPEATLLVVDAVRASAKGEGVKLRVTREMHDEEMRTVRVEVV